MERGTSSAELAEQGHLSGEPEAVLDGDEPVQPGPQGLRGLALGEPRSASAPRRLRRRRGPAAYLPCRVGARLRRLDGWLANLVQSVARLLVPVCQCCTYRLGLVGEAQANTAGAAPTAFAAARIVRRSPQPTQSAAG
jgi:hypothetical protein